MLHKRFADNTSSQSVATRLRRQRFQILLDMMENSSEVSILDIGGTPQYWEMMTTGNGLAEKLHVTLLNLGANATSHPNFTTLVGDGRNMPQFTDRQFDIVFSNSTIEHVGDFEDQQQMANEVRRVGRRYYVQTPNRYFPIEPHFVFPFFQFLPVAARTWLVQHFQLGWMSKMPDREQALREVTNIRCWAGKKCSGSFPRRPFLRRSLAASSNRLWPTRLRNGTQTATIVGAVCHCSRRRREPLLPDEALLASHGRRLLNSEQCGIARGRISVHRNQWHTGLIND